MGQITPPPMNPNPFMHNVRQCLFHNWTSMLPRGDNLCLPFDRLHCFFASRCLVELTTDNPKTQFFDTTVGEVQLWPVVLPPVFWTGLIWCRQQREPCSCRIESTHWSFLLAQNIERNTNGYHWLWIFQYLNCIAVQTLFFQLHWLWRTPLQNYQHFCKKRTKFF